MLLVTTVAADPRGANARLLDILAGLAATHELAVVMPSGDQPELIAAAVHGLRVRLPRWSVVTLYADEGFGRDATALAALSDLLDVGALPVVATASDGSSLATTVARHVSADAQCRLSAEATGRVSVEYFGPPSDELGVDAADAALRLLAMAAV